MNEKLIAILKDEGLEHLSVVLVENGVTDSILNSVSDSDLRELGVEKLGERKRLLSAFATAGEAQTKIGAIASVEGGALPESEKDGNFAAASYLDSTLSTGGASLVFAMLHEDISWWRILVSNVNLFLPPLKSEYDVFDAPTGNLIFKIREENPGFIRGVLMRFGSTFGLKQFVGFKLTVSSPDGMLHFRCEQSIGVMKPSCKVFSPSGATLGTLRTSVSLKPKSTMKIHGGTISVYESTGNKMGIYADKHEITDSGKLLGKIEQIDGKSDAQKLLGAHFSRVSTLRKYAFHYYLSTDAPREHLPLFVSRVYQISHALGL